VTIGDRHLGARAGVVLAAVAALGIVPYLADPSNGAAWIRALTLLSFIAGIGTVWLSALALLGGEHSMWRRLIAFGSASLCSVALVVVLWAGVTFAQEAEPLLSTATIPAHVSPSQLAKENLWLAKCAKLHHSDSNFGCAYLINPPPVTLRLRHPTAPFALVVLVATGAVATAGVLITNKRLRKKPTFHQAVLDSPSNLPPTG
jgi:hypothetical protein